MAITKLKPVDVVIVGAGLTGTIAAKELCDAGIKVVALERGEYRDTASAAMPHAHDGLKYGRRHALMQDLSRETLTFRNRMEQTALPMRQLGSFKPGEGVGGAAVHWGGATWRFLPWDFEMRSRSEARYGKEVFAADCTSRDWASPTTSSSPITTVSSIATASAAWRAT
jgi:gluconate 2-dehydrogenase alpha chain